MKTRSYTRIKNQDLQIDDHSYVRILPSVPVSRLRNDRICKRKKRKKWVILSIFKGVILFDSIEFMLHYFNT